MNEYDNSIMNFTSNAPTLAYFNNAYTENFKTGITEVSKIENNLYIIRNVSISLDKELLLWVFNRDCIIEDIGIRDISIEFKNIDDSVEFYLMYKGYTRDE